MRRKSRIEEGVEIKHLLYLRNIRTGFFLRKRGIAKLS